MGTTIGTMTDRPKITKTNQRDFWARKNAGTVCEYPKSWTWDDVTEAATRAGQIVDPGPEPNTFEIIGTWEDYLPSFKPFSEGGIPVDLGTRVTTYSYQGIVAKLDRHTHTCRVLWDSADSIQDYDEQLRTLQLDLTHQDGFGQGLTALRAKRTLSVEPWKLTGWPTQLDCLSAWLNKAITLRHRIVLAKALDSVY